MTTNVSTADQLFQRLAGFIDALELPAKLSTFLPPSGLVAEIELGSLNDAVALERHILAHRAEFGERGADLRVTVQHPGLVVHLPLPVPNAARGEALLKSFARPTTEF
jgi:hypothetical protein